MVRKIVEVQADSLRKPSLPVKKIDKKILSLVEDMCDTLKAQNDPEGVGLAAPQIGKNLQIFLMSYDNTKRVVINPKVISEAQKKTSEKKSKKILEGCLSLPHYYGPIKRSQKIKIEYLNPSGEKIVEEFSGFLAQIVQHELDHLNGVLFVDRILEQNAPLYQFKGDEWEEVELI
jgi:peptide deformylase